MKIYPELYITVCIYFFVCNLFSCNEFIPYDGVALGVFAVDVLVSFRSIESLGNIRRFCSALNPQIVVYGL